MLKLNSKAELRIHHIVISVLVMSLFGIMLFNATSDFIVTHSNGTITLENLTSEGSEGNRSRMYESVNQLSEMAGEINEMGRLAPGGSESASSSEDATAEGSIIKSGYNFVVNIGNWIYRFPRVMIGTILGFFGLPNHFADVAMASLLIIVVILLVSSILRNKI